MKHLALFNGIGGFQLAAQWMGWENVASVEIDPFCNKVTKHHFPDCIQHEDIYNTDFTIYRGAIDILTGGFPCQPFSVAGKGKGATDNRHLWPEMYRAIRECRPTFIVGENVPGLLTNAGGVVFEQVCTDLESEGYKVQAFIIPACGVNAPHRRDRVWIVAHRNVEQREWVQRGIQPIVNDGSQRPTYYDEAGTVTNAEHPRQHAPEIGCSMGAGNDGNKAGTNEASQFGGRAVSERVVANATSEGRKEREQVTGRENAAQDGTRLDGEHQRHGREWTTPNTGGTGQQERHTTTITEGQGQRTGVGNNQLPNWDGFPTQSPVCRIYDGFSEWMVKLIKPEIYASISKGYTNEDLQEMCNAISSEEVWQQIRRLYKIHEPGILLEILQLCKTTSNNQKGLSVLSEEVSKKILRKVRIFGTLANTPRGRKLGKQQSEQPNDALQFLPHEIALGAMEIQGAVGSFLRNHRRQSIKAYGNSIVPQVAFQILQAIQKTL